MKRSLKPLELNEIQKDSEKVLQEEGQEITMDNYVFVNEDKHGRALGVVKRNGRPEKSQDDPALVSECVLYTRAKTENPKITDEELVLYIYTGLAGKLEKYASTNEATERVENLKRVRGQVKTKST